MAWALAGQGKTGIVINAVYDAWTPARAYQHYHGGVRILSEAASANLASPIEDRKSTRLNSSHGYISYAVFCLKKKKKQQNKSYNQPHQTKTQSQMPRTRPRSNSTRSCTY